MGIYVHRMAWRYLLVVCLLSVEARADTVTFLIAAGTVEPYQVVSVDSQRTPHSGILIDVLQQALSHIDIQLKFVVRPYKRIRMDILANRHQNWISYGSPSWLDERVKALGGNQQHRLGQSTFTSSCVSDVEAGPGRLLSGRRCACALGSKTGGDAAERFTSDRLFRCHSAVITLSAPG